MMFFSVSLDAALSKNLFPFLIHPVSYDQRSYWNSNINSEHLDMSSSKMRTSWGLSQLMVGSNKNKKHLK